MPEPIDTRLSRLRERAERALANGRRGGEVMTVLETMTREAPDGSVHALFAHRHLAEIQLEGSPWRAALHLRRVIDAGAADDGAYALMGLCQALLGNYRAAVSAYRHAVRQSPRNPWYHHNLGHLLDVGLGEATAALDHLRIAHRLQSGEDEITASLAHCLARLGQLDEARTMAERAVSGSPRNREHKVLLDWILEGAPGGKTPPNRVSRKMSGPSGESNANAAANPASSTPSVTDQATPTPRAARVELSAGAGAGLDHVVVLLGQSMPTAGFSAAHVASAHALWSDFCGARPERSGKPAVYAAAVEYAVAKLDQELRVTQTELARRYGVTARAISTRYDEIRSTLELTTRDPRYSR